jgi:hypothetical protein
MDVLGERVRDEVVTISLLTACDPEVGHQARGA